MDCRKIAPEKRRAEEQDTAGLLAEVFACVLLFRMGCKSSRKVEETCCGAFSGMRYSITSRTMRAKTQHAMAQGLLRAMRHCKDTFRGRGRPRHTFAYSSCEAMKPRGRPPTVSRWTPTICPLLLMPQANVEGAPGKSIAL